MLRPTHFTNDDNRKPATKFAGILRSVGRPLAPGMRVLDFGCGNGALVGDLAQQGIDAFGCDFGVREEQNADGRLRALDPAHYAIPFPADTFDAVISNQVFEHVQDYSIAVSEIARVLKPTGVTLHIFPACFRPLEPHVFVPLATRARSYWWLRLWAAAGIRNEYQQHLSASETAARNQQYLLGETKYLSRRAIRHEFSRAFGEVAFCDRAFVRHLSKTWLGGIDDLTLGTLSRGVSALHSRVLFASDPRKSLLS